MPAVPGLQRGLAALYGERLKGVYTFGSRARADADTDSDLDVLDRIDSYAEELREDERPDREALPVSRIHDQPCLHGRSGLGEGEDALPGRSPGWRGAGVNEASAAFLAKAERARDAAETLLRERHAELASGRAYYAMFYVAEAMLADGYGFEPALTIEDVRTMLDRAAEFLLAARSWFAAR